MTKSNSKTKKSKLSNKPSKKVLKKKAKKPDHPPPQSSPESESASESASESESETEIETEDVASLLQPYTKDQLIAFISSAAADDSSLYNRVIEMADRDVSHRKVFVHGLGWDATREDVVAAFSGDGEIEEFKLVTDKVTGRSKGYAFVMFKTRKAAANALKTPQRKINNRVVSCQLASVGPVGPSAPVAERKIYVSNVQRDVDKEKLRGFFEQFGEIETGPLGFDIVTGKSRGFSIFVYRTLEGAKKVLEQPHKMFQGNQLHCQKATDSKSRTSGGSSSNNIDNNDKNVVGNSQVQNPMLAAVAAAQNLALLGQQQHPSAVMNPAVYGGLFAAANPALIHPVMAGHVGALGGGVGGADASVLGAYGTSQGLPSVYPKGTPGSYSGYSSYKWYDFFYVFFICGDCVCLVLVA